MRESSLYTFWGPNATHLGEVRMLRDVNPRDELDCHFAARLAIRAHVPEHPWNDPVNLRDIDHVVITGNHHRVTLDALHLTDTWADYESRRRTAELAGIMRDFVAELAAVDSPFTALARDTLAAIAS